VNNPNKSRLRVLGVDPGSRLTGYGCVEAVGNHLHPVAHGVFKFDPDALFEQRLFSLYEKLSAVLTRYQPDVLAIEKVFFAKNALSALKLGQVRGVVLLCGAQHLLEVVEYAATAVKMSLTGYGRADKTQVAKMVQVLLGAQKFSSLDASDALALAICHVHMALNHDRLFMRPSAGN